MATRLDVSLSRIYRWEKVGMFERLQEFAKEGCLTWECVDSWSKKTTPDKEEELVDKLKAKGMLQKRIAVSASTAPGRDQPLNLDVLGTVQWEGNTFTLPAGCYVVRYGPHGDQNPRIPVTLAKSLVKELVEETRELADMAKDVAKWMSKQNVWCIYWETFLVAFICVDREPCKGFKGGLAHIRAYAVRPKHKRLGEALLNKAFTFWAQEDYVVADVDVGNAASLACLEKSATVFGRGTERIGIVDPKTHEVTMRRNCTTKPGDCVEYVFAKVAANFWDAAKACGAWDGSEGAEAETSSNKKKRGRPSKEAKLTGGARKQYKTAKNAGATGKKKAKK